MLHGTLNHAATELQPNNSAKRAGGARILRGQRSIQAIKSGQIEDYVASFDVAFYRFEPRVVLFLSLCENFTRCPLASCPLASHESQAWAIEGRKARLYLSIWELRVQGVSVVRTGLSKYISLTWLSDLLLPPWVFPNAMLKKLAVDVAEP